MPEGGCQASLFVGSNDWLHYSIFTIVLSADLTLGWTRSPEGHQIRPQESQQGSTLQKGLQGSKCLSIPLYGIRGSQSMMGISREPRGALDTLGSHCASSWGPSGTVEASEAAQGKIHFSEV